MAIHFPQAFLVVPFITTPTSLSSWFFLSPQHSKGSQLLRDVRPPLSLASLRPAAGKGGSRTSFLLRTQVAEAAWWPLCHDKHPPGPSWQHASSNWGEVEVQAPPHGLRIWKWMWGLVGTTVQDPYSLGTRSGKVNILAPPTFVGWSGGSAITFLWLAGVGRLESLPISYHFARPFPLVFELKRASLC